MGDYYCDYECHDEKVKKQQKKEKNKEYEAVVKIMVVETPNMKYRWKTWAAAIVAMVYLLMGISALTVYFFALTFRAHLYSNIHLYLSTVGYQLCLPASILMFSPFDGPAHGVSVDGVKFEHAFTAGFGFVCTFIGSFLGLHHKKVDRFSTFHAWIGLISFILTILSAATGVYMYHTDVDSGNVPKFHSATGLAGYITSTACYILGLYTPSFSEWTLLPAVNYFLMGFSIYNTVVIIYSPVAKLVKQYMQERRDKLMAEQTL